MRMELSRFDVSVSLIKPAHEVENCRKGEAMPFRQRYLVRSTKYTAHFRHVRIETYAIRIESRFAFGHIRSHGRMTNEYPNTPRRKRQRNTWLSRSLLSILRSSKRRSSVIDNHKFTAIIHYYTTSISSHHHHCPFLSYLHRLFIHTSPISHPTTHPQKKENQREIEDSRNSERERESKGF